MKNLPCFFFLFSIFLLNSNLLYAQNEANNRANSYLISAEKQLAQDSVNIAYQILKDALHKFLEEKDLESYFAVLNEKIALDLRLFKLEAAAEDLTKAAQFHKQITARNDTPMMGDLLFMQAHLSYIRNNYVEGIPQVQKAIALYSSLGLKEKEATATRLLGTLYDWSGDYKRSDQTLRKALQLFESIKPLNKDGIAMCYEGLGALYLLFRKYDESESYYQQAINYTQEGGDKGILAHAYTSLGSIYMEQFKYDEALEYSFKGLEILKAYAGEEAPNVAWTQLTIGSVFYQKGQFEQALFHYQESYKLYKKITGISSPESFVTLMNIGSAQSALNKSQEAISVFNTALDNSDQLIERDPNYFLIYLNLARNHLKIADTLSAKQNYAFLEKNGHKYLDNRNPIWIEYYLDQVSLTKSPQIVEEYISKALSLLTGTISKVEQLIHEDFESVIDQSYLFKTIQSQVETDLNFYKLYDQQYYLDRALVGVQQGISLLDNILKSSTVQSSFAYLDAASNHLQNAVEIGRLLYQKFGNSDRLSWMFQVVEKHRALVLEQNIVNQKLRAQLSNKDTIFAKEKALIDRIALERQNLQNEELSFGDSSKIYSQIFNLRLELDGIQERISQKYAQLNSYSNQVNIEEVQDKIGPKEVVLEYFFDQAGLNIFAITKDSFVYHFEEIDAYFSEELDILNQFITTQINPYEEDEHMRQNRLAYLQAGPSLYKKLIAPVSEVLANANTLLIVPDRQLAYTPFEILLTSSPDSSIGDAYQKYPYLLNQFSIRYEYSVKMLRGTTSYPKHKKGQLLAMAPPFPDTLRNKIRNTSISNKLLYEAFPNLRTGYGHLEYNDDEVFAIKQQHANTTILIDNATKNNFIELASNYNILHFATHAFVSKSDPDYSHLVLAKNLEDSTESQLLFAYELANMSLNSELAVLSACQTGTGQYQSIEGIMSLSRAFKAGGCRNIVTTLNAIDDEGTSEFMQLFYTELKNGHGKATALRNAKLQFLRKASYKFRHPFYWSNFILIGDNEPVKLSSNHWLLWPGLGIGMLILFGFSFAYRHYQA